MRLKNLISKFLVFSLALSAAASVTSCGEERFYALSEEKKREYIEEYMRTTYDEEWTATGVILRTDKFAEKFPSGLFISALDNTRTGDTINMWITPEGDIFENRFMLRMREPAKQYVNELVEKTVPYCKAYTFITIDYPELYGDYRKTGNTEPLLTEPNLNIKIELYCSSSEPFNSEDMQKITKALEAVQFDSLDVWNTAYDIREPGVENTVLKDKAKHVASVKKFENGKCSYTHPDA